MELEEMKGLWEDMSQKLEKQELINKQLIMEMTQQKYKSKFRKLLGFESFGALICFAFSILILFNLHKMDTWYLMLCSILCLLFFIVLPIIALRALKNMNSVKITSASYKETLSDFTRKKNRLLLIQKFSATYSILFMFVSIPVFSMIFNNKDFFKQNHELSLWVFMGVVTVALIFFSRWGYRKYKSVTASAEKLLREMEE